MGLLDAIGGSVPEALPEIGSDTPHYEAVGRFVTAFATAEAGVHLLARHLSGLSDAKARVVFSGMRLPDISDIIRKIVEIDKLAPALRATIDDCLTHLGLIAKRRHIIVHRSSIVFDGKLFATNVLTTRSLEAIEGDSFDEKELSDMQSDCRRIYLRLGRISSPESHPVEEDPLLEALIYAGSWRYKFVPPRTPGRKPRSKPTRRHGQSLTSNKKPED